MNGPGHYLLGAACALEAANLTALPIIQTTVVLLVASSTAHGAWSPDIDQRLIWTGREQTAEHRARWGVSHLFPEGTRGHRYITHLWWWPLLFSVYTLGSWWMARISPSVYTLNDWRVALAWSWLPAAGLTIGWGSHLLGDFLFGKDTGIPMTPYGRHVGLKVFKVGQGTERFTTAAVLPAAVALESYLELGGHFATVLGATGHLAGALHR